MIRYIKLAIICLFTLSGINSFSQTYCSPVYTSGCPFSNYITNVNIGTINHSPPGCTVSNYTAISTLIPAGVATTITVTTSGYIGAAVAVDLNNNGSFSDAGEVLAVMNYNGSSFSAPYSASITIPGSTPNGSYRMRCYSIGGNSGGGTGGILPSNDPCATYGYGSFDDYTLVVYHQCATINSVTATPSQICTSGTSSLTCSYTSFSPATVKWYYENGTLAGTGSPFVTPTLTTTTTFYAAADNGTCDTPRAPLTVIVIPPAAAPISITPTDTTICEGKIVKIETTRGTVIDSVIAKQGTLTATKTPINGTSVNSVSELIYLSSELNVAGTITDFGFFKTSTSTNTTFNPGNVTVYMKNTTATTVTNTASTSGYDLVYTGPWPNVGVAANTWNNLTLTAPFDYLGGANNLSILIVRTAAPTSPVFAPKYRASSSSPNNRVSFYTLNTAWVSGVTVMTLDTLRPDIKIKYKVKPTINWSPVTNLFKDASLTLPINASDTQSVVYAHPNVTTTYSAYGNLYGCLSTGFLTSHIVVNDTVHVLIADSVCIGSSYVFGTQTLTTTGTYTESFQATNACDSVVTINFSIRPYITNTVAVSICQGQTYTFNGNTYSTSQTGLKDTFSTTGCDSIVTLNLTVNPNITPTFTAVPAICNGSTAPVLPTTSTNGYTGTWSPATVSNTATTTYTFTPTAGQCATTTTLTVTVNPIVTPTFTAIAPICSGVIAPVLPTTSTNGITGTWSPATVSNTATATYTFTPTAGLCASTTTLTVTVNPNVTPTFTAIAPICNGATAPVLPTTSNNGITGTWSPATVSNTATTTYTFTPTAGLCALTTTLTVTVNPNVTPTFTIPGSICNGATAPVLPTTSNNGITGTWSPATVSNTATGTYTFTPTAGLCALATTVTVNVNNNTVPTFTAIPAFCKNTTAPLLPATSNNGITGTWSPATVSNTASGTYTFTPTPGLCALTATMNITVKNPSIYTEPITICDNQQPYTWNGINGAINGTVYTTTAANNCDSVVTLNLTVLPPAVTTTIDTFACGFLWYNNVQYNQTTTVRDTFSNFLGCDSFIRITHIIIYPNVPYTKVIDTLDCNIVHYEGNNYFDNTKLVDTFINIHGCDSVIRIVNITVDKFELNLSVSQEEPYKGEPINLISSGNNNYVITAWSPADWFPDQEKTEYRILATEDGIILINGTDEYGCTDTAEVRYTVKPLDYGVFIPNAFTPNGDGKNDKFFANFYMKRAYVIKTFKVFNRYGQVVYSRFNDSDGWDGTMNNGKPADMGNYSYFMEAEFIDGKNIKLKGDVVLIR
ncbi:gliding motility-associated C-terminal domain-containing protein [Taibaiella lutea]|uniref:Gliding motility-associated C-terminal domain-containing protein n=1 Tax=Taibaiella lutea TaxID=2608001 RepID=A0A5M6CBL1_9BACT|nr:gliding motility-associated C-terminal domain-containing protein [Taibaiella lutea]KAA5532373.1 gliding motility-associated C-terminal domain-containing protein [Taibaiella lutea]